jgi:hypothetical protein
MDEPTESPETTDYAEISKKVNIDEPHNQAMLEYIKGVCSGNYVAYDTSHLKGGSTDKIDSDHLVIQMDVLIEYAQQIKTNARNNKISTNQARIYWKQMIYDSLISHPDFNQIEGDIFSNAQNCEAFELGDIFSEISQETEEQ